MRVQFEITADLVEERTQMGVDLTIEEIDELSEEVEDIVKQYFQRVPWATIGVNRILLTNVEASGSKFYTLDRKAFGK